MDDAPLYLQVRADEGLASCVFKVALHQEVDEMGSLTAD